MEYQKKLNVTNICLRKSQCFCLSKTSRLPLQRQSKQYNKIVTQILEFTVLQDVSTIFGYNLEKKKKKEIIKVLDTHAILKS